MWLTGSTASPPASVPEHLAHWTLLLNDWIRVERWPGLVWLRAGLCVVCFHVAFSEQGIMGLLGEQELGTCCLPSGEGAPHGHPLALCLLPDF